MKLDRDGIARCVPHSGAMLLLDSVSEWDTDHIVCSAPAPGAAHPLAREGKLSAVAAIEYGAQAAAVHGYLVEQPVVPRSGMLAKLSDVHLSLARVPADRGALCVHARLLSRLALGCLYEFEIASAGERVAHGRLMVAFAKPADQ